MPGTYTPSDAMTVVSEFVHGIPVTAVQAQVCDFIYSRMWTAVPWRWTQAALTPINLVDGTQDYANPNSATMLRLVNARVVRTDLSPTLARELLITSFLAPELAMKGGLYTLSAVTWLKQNGQFRLDRAASVTTPVTLQIQGEYQSLPTKITSANLATFLVDFPDTYFHVFVEGVKWKFYQLADDPRAGTVGIARSDRKQYTGQLGVFMEALAGMLSAEDYGDGLATRFPDEPLGVPARGINPGLFAFT